MCACGCVPLCSLGCACGPLCSWVSVLVCGHVSRWPGSLDVQMCEPVFPGPVCRDLCVLRGHHSRWFCLNLWAPPRARAPMCVAGLCLSARGSVCVRVDACGLRACTGRRPLRQGPHAPGGARTPASSPARGRAPAPAGTKRSSALRGGSGVRLRGGEPRVEPGKKPRDPFISVSRRSHQVIECVCLSLCLLRLCLSLSVCASSALSQALWPWLSCLHNFLWFFPLP